MTTDVGTTERNVSTRRRLAIFERDKGCCKNCGKQIAAGERWILEHVRALELGGSNEDDNLAVFCAPCAGSKTQDDHSRAAKAKRQKARAHGMKQPSKPLQSAGFAPVDKSTKASRLRPVSKFEGLGPPALARRFAEKVQP